MPFFGIVAILAVGVLIGNELAERLNKRTNEGIPTISSVLAIACAVIYGLTR